MTTTISVTATEFVDLRDQAERLERVDTEVTPLYIDTWGVDDVAKWSGLVSAQYAGMAWYAGALTRRVQWQARRRDTPGTRFVQVAGVPADLAEFLEAARVNVDRAQVGSSSFPGVSHEPTRLQRSVVPGSNDDVERLVASVIAQFVKSIQAQFRHLSVGSSADALPWVNPRLLDSPRVAEVVTAALEPLVQALRDGMEALRQQINELVAPRAIAAAPVPSTPALLPQIRGAVEDLRTWLNISLEEVASLAGVSARSLTNWRHRDTEPHPSSARRLLEIHAQIEALVRQKGEPEAVAWLRQPLDNGQSRLTALADPMGAARVAADVRRTLFPSARPPEPWRTSSDIDIAPDGAGRDERWEVSELGPPRRPRQLAH